MDQWEAVTNHAKRLCLGSTNGESSEEDVDMSETQEDSMQNFVRGVMDEKISKDLSWKGLAK